MGRSPTPSYPASRTKACHHSSPSLRKMSSCTVPHVTGSDGNGDRMHHHHRIRKQKGWEGGKKESKHYFIVLVCCGPSCDLGSTQITTPCAEPLNLSLSQEIIMRALFYAVFAPSYARSLSHDVPTGNPPSVSLSLCARTLKKSLF